MLIIQVRIYKSTDLDVLVGRPWNDW